MNILIVRVSAIGDVVHTLPAIALIKNILPSAKIHWLVQQKATALLENQSFLTKLWILPNKFLRPKNLPHTFQIVKELRKTKWDSIIDFQGIARRFSEPAFSGEVVGVT